MAEILEATHQKTGLSTEFPRDFLSFLKCSRDGGGIRVAREGRSGALGLIEADLRCETCGSHYSIENGVARLIIDSMSPEDAHELKLREEEYGTTQPGLFAQQDAGWRSALSDLLEMPDHLAELQPLHHCRVLELGCGDGRFTTVMAAMGAEVLAVDFSLNALRLLATRLHSGAVPPAYDGMARSSQEMCSRVGLVQANINHFFVAHRSFDRALAATPLDSRDQRMIMYRCISDALMDSGRFIGGVEHDDLTRRLLGLPTARRYSKGGIFIEHFDCATYRREVAPFFLKIKIRPIRPALPFIRRLPLSLAVLISRALARLPGVRSLGEILLLRAEQPVRMPEEGASRPGSRLAKTIFHWYTRRQGKPPVWGTDEEVMSVNHRS